MKKKKGQGGRRRRRKREREKEEESEERANILFYRESGTPDCCQVTGAEPRGNANCVFIPSNR